MIVRIRPFLDIEKIVSVLVSTKETDTHLVEEFEEAFAAYIETPCAFAVHQGRSALLLALKILDIKHGDEVIVQSYIISCVIDAIQEVGARPVLVDCCLDDFNISPQAIAKEITPRTKAIIATHLSGIPCDIEDISNIAKDNNCFLIEDCAHALGAQYNGKNVSIFGDMSFFSFDIDKPFSTGDGGMLVINNLTLLEKAQHILNLYKRVSFKKEKESLYGLILQHLVTKEEIYPERSLAIDFGKSLVKRDRGLLSFMEHMFKNEGFQEHNLLSYIQERYFLSKKNPENLRRFLSKALAKGMKAHRIVGRPKIDSDKLLMNSLRSAVGIACLEDFNKAKDIRNRNAQVFASSLNNSAYTLPQIDKRKKPAFIRYIILNNTEYENADIAHSAKRRGFEIGIFNWGKPVHLCYPYNILLSFERGKLRNSEYLGRKLLSLPVHPYVDESAVKKIAALLNGFGAKSDV